MQTVGLFLIFKRAGKKMDHDITLSVVFGLSNSNNGDVMYNFWIQVGYMVPHGWQSINDNYHV